MLTSTVTCRCKNSFQDGLYGLGKRVANYSTKKGNPDNPVGRCTVCSMEHSLKKAIVPRVSKKDKKDKKESSSTTI